MKIIIEQGGIKRQIVGSFRICGSREDLAALAAALAEKTPAYGWIDVIDQPRAVPNTPPLPWDAP